jgi:predicted RNase H-like HicB family nuclease
LNVSYYAIFQYDPDGLWVQFPDLPGCFSCGDNDEDAKRMAGEALQLYLEDIPKDMLPTPTDLSDISLVKNQKAVLISCDIN